jgi:hypothetical protein
VILSLTQLYRYTPEIFLFSAVTFRYTYRDHSDELDKTIQQNKMKIKHRIIGEYATNRCFLLKKLTIVTGS